MTSHFLAHWITASTSLREPTTWLATCAPLSVLDPANKDRDIPRSTAGGTIMRAS